MSGSINLTENAVTRIQGLSAGSDNDKFRVYVTGGGCSGFQYGFKLDAEVAFDDDVIEFKDFCSKAFLIKAINNHKVICEIEAKPDRYKRKLGECFVKQKSLSRILVRNGYAFDYPRYSKKKYAKDQEFAKNNNLGLWDMKFEFPWDFRKKN